MADDVEHIKLSLEEIKSLLQNERKKQSTEIGPEIFTDPRFIEIFESYFKPLVDSSRKIHNKLTEKSKLNVFDIIGISDRQQDIHRNRIIKGFTKIIDKIEKTAKNINKLSDVSLQDFTGITRSDKSNNRRLIKDSIDTLTRNIRQSAKNLGDPKNLSKIVGLKFVEVKQPKIIGQITPAISLAQQNKASQIEPPVVIEDVASKKTKKVDNEIVVY